MRFLKRQGSGVSLQTRSSEQLGGQEIASCAARSTDACSSCEAVLPAAGIVNLGLWECPSPSNLTSTPLPLPPPKVGF